MRPADQPFSSLFIAYVLVALDTFTKWMEVAPLRHDVISVAAAFTDMCKRWGAPAVVRMDNESEFRNAVMEYFN